MGNYTVLESVTSRTKGASSQFFQQGLEHAFGFNQDEAQNSFFCCLEADPTNSLCAWGLTYAYGPFLNKPNCGEEDLQLANYYAKQAVELLDDTYTAEEVALISSAPVRFPTDDINFNQTEAYEAYRNYMADVHDKFPNDVDLATFYAESEMTLSSSAGLDFYVDSKEMTHSDPTQSSIDAMKALEFVMSKVDQPLALHLYIHITEPLSPGSDAAKGELSADKLARLNYTGSGHMEHMPGHLYLRVGRYNDVIKNNVLATNADDLYDANKHIAYGPAHNVYFLAVAAALDGQLPVALEYSEKMRDIYLSGHYDDGPGDEEGWNAYLIFLLRFGKFDEILNDAYAIAIPEIFELPDVNYAILLGHFARGVSFYKQGSVDDAQKCLEQVNTLMASDELALKYLARSKVASYTLSALVYDDVEYWRLAADEQNSWGYNSPPHWALSSNTCYGSKLLSTNNPVSALAAFETDLAEYPINPWALYGRYQAMNALPDTFSAEEISEALNNANKAWERSEESLMTPCWLLFSPETSELPKLSCGCGLCCSDNSCGADSGCDCTCTCPNCSGKCC